MFNGFSVKKIWLIVIIIIALVQISIFNITQHYQKQVYFLHLQQEADVLVKAIQQNIVEKQLATTAIALSISLEISDLKLNKDLPNQSRLQRLIEQINNYSDYKNLWVQVINAKGEVLYRSWSNKVDSLMKIRPEFSKIASKMEPIRSISSGRFDLSIKSVTPIIADDKLIGYLDLISHFNSIQHRLKEMDVDSLVVATKERSALITRPFSKNAIGDFYIANLNPDMDFYQQLTSQKLESWMQKNEKYWVEGNKLLVRYPLTAVDNKVHGYLFASTAISDLGAHKNEATSLKELVEFIWQINIFMVIALLMAVALYLNMRQKGYYRDILNYEQEAVLVTNGIRMIDANSQLYSYFPAVRNKGKKCICDHFADAPGFLQKQMGDQLWIDYVIANPELHHKVLTKNDGVERIFSLRATKLGSNETLYVVVLSEITELENLNKKLLAQSRTDELTGLGNRLSFNETIEREIMLALRKQQPLSLILFDIDYFKKINDTFGHLVGDQVLSKLASLVRNEIRGSDLVFRMGGEEFIILLTNQSHQDAFAVAEKVRLAIAQYRFQIAGSITISLGVTEYQDNEHLNDLLTRVDTALYKAKGSGRNQTKLG